LPDSTVDGARGTVDGARGTVDGARFRPDWSSAGLGLLRALLIGLALGAAARATKYSPDVVRWVLTLGVPWLATAFAVGVFARRPLEGAAHGGLLMVAAVVAYYFIGTGIERHYGPLYSAAMIVGWGSLGAVAGGVFGAAGAAWRGGPSWLRIGAAALLCGALAGEAIVYLSEGFGPAAEAAMRLELLVALVLAIFLNSGRRKVAATLAATAGVAAVAAVVEKSVRILMHAGGWGGA